MRQQDENIIIIHQRFAFINNYHISLLVSITHIIRSCHFSIADIAVGTGSSDVIESSFWLSSRWSTRYFVINVIIWLLLLFIYLLLRTTFWAGIVLYEGLAHVCNSHLNQHGFIELHNPLHPILLLTITAGHSILCNKLNPLISQN